MPGSERVTLSAKAPASRLRCDSASDQLTDGPPRQWEEVCCASAEQHFGDSSLCEEGYGELLGAESLPLVGVAGVLVLPRMPIKGIAEYEDDRSEQIRLLFDGEDLCDWGDDWEEPPLERFFDESWREKRLADYVAAEAKPSRSSSSAALPLQQLKALADTLPPPSPAAGPGLLTLARNPRRREECPVCATEWRRALEDLGEDVPEPRPSESVPAVRRRAVSRGSVRMHSIRCHWAWFGENLASRLCALRFEPSTGAPRPSPPSPSTVLPPPMLEVWQHWRTSKGQAKTDRERVAQATERLVKGESASQG